MQVNALLLHPLLLEVEPVYLRLVPLPLQLSIAPQGQMNAFLQFFKSFGIAFLLFVELCLHVCQLFIKKSNLLILIFNECGQCRILLGENLQFNFQLLYLPVLFLDSVTQVADHVVLLAAAHRHHVFYIAQLPPQQLILLPQDLVLFLERFHRRVERLREGLVRTDAA